MIPNALTRLLAMLPTALVLILLVVGLIDWVPGDPLDALLGEQALPADRAAIATALGLDLPFFTRFSLYLQGVLVGDWGHSLMNNTPVTTLLWQRLPATAVLALAAMGVAVVLALGVGAAMAFMRGRAAKALNIASLGLMVTPSFVLGPLLIALLAVKLNWLPVAGMSGAQSLVLPALTLGIGLGMVLARFVGERLAVLWAQPALQMAKAKGNSRLRRFWRHALPQAMGPVAQIFFLQLGMVLTGAVLTEAVFGWPGLGSLLIESLHQRDYPVLQGCLLLIALTYMVCVWLSDVVALSFDKRISLNNSL